MRTQSFELTDISVKTSKTWEGGGWQERRNGGREGEKERKSDGKECRKEREGGYDKRYCNYAVLMQHIFLYIGSQWVIKFPIMSKTMTVTHQVLILRVHC